MILEEIPNEEYYTVGSVRICRKFVIRKTVNGETRYFQVAIWKEEYVHVFMASFDNHYEWRPICWLTEKEFDQININPNKVPSVGL